MLLSEDTKNFVIQTFSAVAGVGVVAFFVAIWKFFRAASEIPRMRNGIQVMFKRLKKIEKKLGIEEES